MQAAPAPVRHVEPAYEEVQPYEPEYQADEYAADGYDPAETYEPPTQFSAPQRYAHEPEVAFTPAPQPPAYDTTLFDDPKPRAPQPDTAETARVAPTAVAKSKKPATGWAAILGIGGEKEAKPTSKGRGRSQWAGGRRRVLIGQIVIGGVIALLVFGELHNLVAPPSGPSYEQVQAAARAAVGDTGFPQTQGAAVATGFTKSFFNFSAANAALRESQLLQFTSQDVLNDIETNYASQDDSAKKISQQLVDGPYVVSMVASSATDAVATVSLTLTGAPDDSGAATAKVLYVSLPLHYDKARNAIAVSGSPTFLPSSGVSTFNDLNLKPSWVSDDNVQTTIDASLLPQFFTAWGISSSADLKNLLAGNAATTLRAKTGLKGAVTYVANSVTDTSVQQAGDGSSTPTHRKFQTTVSWLDQVTGATYSQTYRGWILRQPSGSWTVEDINNAANISGK